MRFGASFAIIGHRGAAGLEPENTLRSFERAARLGVNAVELDVYGVNGRLVVIHDDTVDRTTNGRGPVDSHSFEALRALDAGRGERIPTLEEVLEVLPEAIGVNVELKGPGTASPVARVLDATEREFLVSSFKHAQLRDFIAQRQDVPVAPLFGRWREDALQIAAELGAVAINISDRIATAARIEQIRSEGLDVYVYTVNELARASVLREADASGVFTDYPDRLGDRGTASIPPP